MQNKCVLRADANTLKDVVEVTEMGSMFQRRGLPRVTDLTPSTTILDGGRGGIEANSLVKSQLLGLMFK